jgi:hypothetical protein
MAKQTKSVHKKTRGRPAGRAFGETIPVRLSAGMIAAVELWAVYKSVSRSEALRTLIEIGLKKEASKK